MTKPNIIAPSILSADFAILGKQISEAEDAGADWIHIDVMDGHFVPNLTMGPVVVAACRRATMLPLDVHLMVTNPEQLLKSFAEAGADRLTFHVEATDDIEGMIAAVKELGCRVGLALNPVTPADAIEKALPLVDMALIMTVNPGYSGQAFIPKMLPKIDAVRQKLNEVNPKAIIQVDGGIDAHTISSARDAGANVFVAGSAIFNHEDGIARGVQALKTALGD